jgi:hypothetical protein
VNFCKFFLYKKILFINVRCAVCVCGMCVGFCACGVNVRGKKFFVCVCVVRVRDFSCAATALMWKCKGLGEGKEWKIGRDGKKRKGGGKRREESLSSLPSPKC